ncbi:hypothetical protein [uncultured Eubacterium sp.]|uniref:hypothetical protein n=1 Tax=uncultured Eubacterium sp. TaxID=165185 RepID=UPI0025DEEE3A|nr:hypothetical protein [uncultured Eubacterium sp.]
MITRNSLGAYSETLVTAMDLYSEDTVLEISDKLQSDQIIYKINHYIMKKPAEEDIKNFLSRIPETQD